MHDDASNRGIDAPRLITRQSQVYFLLARPIEDTDSLPSSIGESDVFFSEAEALDALDVHYAWCAARSGGFTRVVTTAQWYLQSALVGPRIAPALGEVYLAATDNHSGETWAAAAASSPRVSSSTGRHSCGRCVRGFPRRAPRRSSNSPTAATPPCTSTRSGSRH